MAHVAKLGALTDELVNLITSVSARSEPTRFSIYKESALRTLRYSNHPRTNQFDVSSQLDGLEEKFRVYNEDPLADALRERLDKLEELEIKWAPEILHLLLELSNKPLSNPKLEYLDFLKEPEVDTGPPLQWMELAKEDPLLRDKKIWKNVDFGTESSDGEDFADSQSEASEFTENTTRSSLEADPSKRPEDYQIQVGSKEDLLKLRDAQFWLKTPKVNGVALETVKKPITELQAIRETIFMLGGLTTSLFRPMTNNPQAIEASKSYTLKHASPGAFYQVIKDFANQGSTLSVLRNWADSKQSIPLLQVFQGVIHQRLAAFEKKLSDIQERVVDPKRNTIVSFLSLQTETSPFMRPLVRLSIVVQTLKKEPYAHAFRYLELLFDETCMSQMAGDEDLYRFFGRVFFECLQVYLRPLRIWMEEGELIKGDKTFFISEATGEADPASTWKSRFKLRQTQDRVLHAPRFLRAAASKIFTSGKSVVVLKLLNQFPSLQNAGLDWEPTLDFDTVCNPSLLYLAPFAELFETAFDSWIESKHSHASSTLRKILFSSCGLQTSLEALSEIFFMANGATAAGFTNHIFDKLDTLDDSWCDNFAITELAKSTFGSLPAVNPDRLRTTIRPLRRKDAELSKLRRTVKVLEVIQLRYNLSWPLQIVLPMLSVTSYQQIFTFLFQVRRSTHVLSRQRFIVDTHSVPNSSAERALYYGIRIRLMWFLQTLYYYLTCLVLSPSSTQMRDSLKAARDVDSMVLVHSTYIKSTVEKCLLGSKLELIHKTILKILDLAIKLEDAQAANAVVSREVSERQQEMMDMSMASLGLHTPRKPSRGGYLLRQSFRRSTTAPPIDDSDSSSNEDNEIDVDLSIMSSNPDDGEELYIDKLKKIKADFDRLVRFVGSGLKGVARASGGDEARAWDTLGEMIESGLSNEGNGFGRA
ncbi:Spc98 family-domain-containing protein [Tricladium varicosporioides]|nr:Spc98 family-domain-containing protein [Hymenoscyphus varicosporioides]